MFLLKTPLTEPYPPPHAGMPTSLMSRTTLVTKASWVVRAWSPETPGAAAMLLPKESTRSLRDFPLVAMGSPTWSHRQLRGRPNLR